MRKIKIGIGVIAGIAILTAILRLKEPDQEMALGLAVAVLIAWMDRRTAAEGHLALIFSAFVALPALAWTIDDYSSSWRAWLIVGALAGYGWWQHIASRGGCRTAIRQWAAAIKERRH